MRAKIPGPEHAQLTLALAARAQIPIPFGDPSNNPSGCGRLGGKCHQPGGQEAYAMEQIIR